jgi:hypothetical protein
MRNAIVVAGLVLGLSSTAARAAVPEYGTRDGELACTGLLDYAFRGASASKSPVPEVVTAITAAFSFYIGRLSKADPAATRQDALQAVEKLSLEEKNAYGTVCMKKSAEIMGTFLR